MPTVVYVLLKERDYGFMFYSVRPTVESAQNDVFEEESRALNWHLLEHHKPYRYWVARSIYRWEVREYILDA